MWRLRCAASCRVSAVTSSPAPRLSRQKECRNTGLPRPGDFPVRARPDCLSSSQAGFGEPYPIFPASRVASRLRNLAMMLSRVPRLLVAFVVVAVFLLAKPQPGKAQKGPPPVPPNPQAPTLKPVFPTGMQRGTTLDLTLTGTNLAEPTGLWTSFPAKVTMPTANNNGKGNPKVLR